MFCVQCGKKQASEALFCQFCGTKLPIATSQTAHLALGFPSKPQEPPLQTVQSNGSGNGFGIAGLVLGALSTGVALFEFWLIVSGNFGHKPGGEAFLLLFVAVLGTIFSAIGTSKNSSAAIAGLIFSILGMFLSALLTTLI
jgi:hypothetical protein